MKRGSILYSIIMLVLTLLSLGCSKENIEENPNNMDAYFNNTEAIITGFTDSISDECEGGYYINIVGSGSQGSNYLSRQLPENLKGISNKQFPVYIIMDWSLVKNKSCYNKYIYIKSARLK